MTRQHRFLIVPTVGLIAAALLVGCGGSDGGSTSGTSTTSTTKPAASTARLSAVPTAAGPVTARLGYTESTAMSGQQCTYLEFDGGEKVAFSFPMFKSGEAGYSVRYET